MTFTLGSRPSVSEARDALTATIGADPFAKLAELARAGERKARAEGIAYQLQEQRKIVLSRIASELAQVHKGLSEAKLERMARADPRYEDHVKGTAAAIGEKELAAAEYWTLQAELTWMEKTVAHANALSRLER